MAQEREVFPEHAPSDSNASSAHASMHLSHHADGDSLMNMNVDQAESIQAPPQPKPQRRIQHVNPLMEEQRQTYTDQVAEEVEKRFHEFLCEFQGDASDYSSVASAAAVQPLYLTQLEKMEESDLSTMYIDFNHVKTHNQHLATVIQDQFYRMDPYLRQALSTFVRQYRPNHFKPDGMSQPRKFFLSFYNLPGIVKIRDVQSTDRIGQLSTFTGVVTRTTEVRPELVHANFTCGACRTGDIRVEQQFKYTTPKKCGNPQCQNRREWELEVESSEFVDWQRIRVQENSEDIPPGSMPRSMDVIMRNELVEACKPGDKVVYVGTLIVVPDVAALFSSRSGKGGPALTKQSGASQNEGVSGVKGTGVRQMTYRMMFLASSVTQAHKQFGQADIRGGGEDADEDDNEFIMSLTDEDKEEIRAMKDAEDIFGRLARSVAPNIYGHEDIKKGILLMLFGGVVKKTHDKVKLRGDINICIVGDPSTAKSQFLKYVTRIMPRTVYTSGKASTAAGLTAAVQKDPDTGEFAIEAGALMLADNGICCIDEFDKMDAFDQAAIHEAMEQQTITITKAGIQATLNARASILAAANPIFGRYDTSKPLRWNVDMSAPIMSRFDLFFVVLDECDEEVDNNVATHIVSLHQNADGARPPTVEYTIEQMQKYIRFARMVKPVITNVSRKLLKKYYRQLRQSDAEERKAYRFTVRQLESMIRLSEAMARVHLDEEVKPIYVKEAARLLKMSIISVDTPEVQIQFDREDEDETMDDHEQQAAAITFQEYTRMVSRIVRYVRMHETIDSPGMAQAKVENQIVEMYVQENAEEVGDEDKLATFMTKVQYVIRRLIGVDHILLVHTDAEEEKDRILEVHPNYDPDINQTSRLVTQRDRERVEEEKRKDAKEAAEKRKQERDAAKASQGEEDGAQMAAAS